MKLKCTKSERGVIWGQGEEEEAYSESSGKMLN